MAPGGASGRSSPTLSRTARLLWMPRPPRYNSVEDMKTFTIGVIAGDGVGEEVIPQAKRVLESVAKKHDVSFAFQDFDWGANHFFRWGRMMPAGAIDLLQPCDAILLGAVGHPQIPDHTTL